MRCRLDAKVIKGIPSFLSAVIGLAEVKFSEVSICLDSILVEKSVGVVAHVHIE